MTLVDLAETRKRVRLRMASCMQRWIHAQHEMAMRAWKAFLYDSRASEVRTLHEESAEKLRLQRTRIVVGRLRRRGQHMAFVRWKGNVLQRKRLRYFIQRMRALRVMAVFRSWHAGMCERRRRRTYSQSFALATAMYGSSVTRFPVSSTTSCPAGVNAGKP